MHIENNTDVYIFSTQKEATITCRADLIRYVANLSIIYCGLNPAIKMDQPLGNILEAYNIPFPDGGNHEIMRILKKDGVLYGIEHVTDSEYSSVNTLFHTLEGFCKFVENFVDWIEANHKVGRPTIAFDTSNYTKIKPPKQ